MRLLEAAVPALALPVVEAQAEGPQAAQLRLLLGSQRAGQRVVAGAPGQHQRVPACAGVWVNGSMGVWLHCLS